MTNYCAALAAHTLPALYTGDMQYCVFLQYSAVTNTPVTSTILTTIINTYILTLISYHWRVITPCNGNG